MRAALIGCGRMGGFIDDEVVGHPTVVGAYSHAAGYAAVDGIELVAASDIMEAQMVKLCERYGVDRSYTDYREMILNERPDIVSITTRPISHCEMTVFCAEHGVKGIYLEKPMCCSMAEADAMVEACERNGVKFNLGTNRRFQDAYHKMRDVIESGQIGDLEAVIMHASGSALWGHSHASDMLMFIAGDPQVEFVQGSVSADPSEYSANRLSIDPNIHSGYVKFANGVHGYILAVSGYEYEVSGKNGKLRMLNNGLSGTIRVLKGDRWKTLVDAPFPEYQMESAAENIIRDLMRAIRTDAPTRGDIQLARRSHEIIMGIIDSNGKMGARVRLPMDNRELYVACENW